MSNAEAAKLYESIIEDVIAESRQDFEDSGIDEATLQDLRALWRERLSSTRVAQFPWDPVSEPHIPDALDASIPVDLQLGGQRQQQPLLLVPQSDIKLPSPTPKVEDDGQSQQTHIMLPGGGIVNQADGAPLEISIELSDEDSRKLARYQKKIQRRQKKIVVQADGADDDSDDSVFGNVGDSDDINSDLDDPDDDELNSDEDNDEQETNIMLCLYDRVQRIKNKWKCTLKDGITNIDGRDYAFQKATGDSEW